MAQNIYDKSEFFAGYATLPRSIQGLNGAPEWNALQSMLPELTHKSVLDLGCGYGWFCRKARELGADFVTGIDISEKMLNKAQEMTSDPNINYIQQNLEDLNINADSFDLVFSSLTFHYLPDLEDVFKNIYHCLKIDGHFVFSMEHPIFTSASKQGWITDESGERFWGINQYQNEGMRVTNWFTDGVIKYHRTLSRILNILIEQGFVIQKIDEWGPTQQQIETNPSLKEEAERPMLVLYSAVKIQR